MLAHRRMEAQIDYHYPLIANLRASRAIRGAADGVMASVDTVRTYIDQNGILQIVSAADDYRISHVLKGSRLEPALLLEPAAANILLGTPPTTQDLTLGIGSFTLQVFGAGTAEAAAGTATITGAGTASNGTPVTFAVTAGGTVTITITTATVVWLCPRAIPSSYFAGAAAIGDELLMNGNFSAVVDNTGELSSGVLTVGNCYLISAHTDTDFTLLGAPDSNVGTYFNATATGADGILDAGDKVFPVTFTNWTGTGSAPQAVAGSLTGKLKITGDNLVSQSAGVTNKVYRLQLTISGRTTGYVQPYAASTASSGFASADGTYTFYVIGTATVSGVVSGNGFNGAIDDFSVKEHGTVRLSEAAKLTFVNPTKLIASLADEFTIVGFIRFDYAKTQVTSIAHLLAFATSGFFYHNASGVLTITDGINLATNTIAYVANTWYRFEIKGSGSEMSLGVQTVESAVSWGSAGTFNGAITTTGNVIYPGYTMQGAFMLKDIFAFQGILSDQQIKRLPMLG